MLRLCILTHTHIYLFVYTYIYVYTYMAWGGVVVKALRYYSEVSGIDPRLCRWEFFPWHPTIPCARVCLSLLKWVPGYSWGKDGRSVWLTTYHLQVPMSRNLEALTSPVPSGPHRPVMGLLNLYTYILKSKWILWCKWVYIYIYMHTIRVLYIHVCI
jgi:hypothetical protein